MGVVFIFVVGLVGSPPYLTSMIDLQVLFQSFIQVVFSLSTATLSRMTESPSIILESAEAGSTPIEHKPWEDFSEGIALEGLSYTQAYLKYVKDRDNCNDDNIFKHASRVGREGKVKARIAYLRKQLGESITERIGITADYLARHHMAIIETPIGEIDENHPLAQEWHREQAGSDEGPIIKTRVKMPAKDSSLKALADLIGANAPVKSQIEGSVTVGKAETMDDLASNTSACYALGQLLRQYPAAMEAIRAGMECREIGAGVVLELPAS